MIPTDKLREWWRLSKKCSPGPWRLIDGWDEQGNGKYFPSICFTEDNKHRILVVNESHDRERESIMANAKLMAISREAIPVLVAEVVRLRVQIETMMIFKNWLNEKEAE
jgi:hypothetical protein